MLAGVDGTVLQVSVSKQQPRTMMMLSAVSALALVSPCVARDLMQTSAATTVEADSQAQRLKLAAHTIGVNSAFMEVCHSMP